MAVPSVRHFLSRRLVTAKARVRSQASPCGISDGQSSPGTDFPSSPSVFFCHYHSTNGPCISYIYDRSHIFFVTESLTEHFFVFKFVENFGLLSKSILTACPYHLNVLCLQVILGLKSAVFGNIVLCNLVYRYYQQVPPTPRNFTSGETVFVIHGHQRNSFKSCTDRPISHASLSLQVIIFV
jgi:hypothetical protein